MQECVLSLIRIFQGQNRRLCPYTREYWSAKLVFWPTLRSISLYNLVQFGFLKKCHLLFLFWVNLNWLSCHNHFVSISFQSIFEKFLAPVQMVVENYEVEYLLFSLLSWNKAYRLTWCRYHTFQAILKYCLKSVQIRSYFWSVFSCIRTEYRKIRTRNNSVSGYFSSNILIFDIMIIQREK